MGLIAAGAEAHVVDQPGGIFVRRAEQMSDEDRILLQTVARVIVDDSGGTLADQLERRGRRRARVPRRSQPSANDRAETADRRAAAPGATWSLLQRPRRLHAATAASTSSRPRRATATPAPWVNVLANPQFGTVVSRERRRLHLVRERPRVPPHALVQRPGQRHERRGVLPPRRGDRPVLVADAAARPRGDAVRHPPRLRLQHLRAHRGRHRHRAHAVYVATDAPVKFVGAQARATARAGHGASRRPAYCEWVLGDLRPRSLMHVATEVDPQDRRALRAQPVQPRSSPTASPSSTASEARARVTGDRTEFLGRNGTPGEPRRHDARPALRPRRRRRSIRAPRCRSLFELAARPGTGDRLHPRRRPRRRRRPQPGPALPRRRRRAQRARRRLALLEPHARRGLRRDARPRGQLPGQRLAALPDARLPHLGPQRLLPVGRRVRLPRPVAGRDGAGPRRAAPAARASAPLRGPPVPRGRRAALVAPARRAAACARTSPTTTSGCRCATCRYVAATGDTGVLDERMPVPRRPPGEARRGSLLRPAHAVRRGRHALRALRARDRRTACASARTACR